MGRLNKISPELKSLQLLKLKVRSFFNVWFLNDFKGFLKDLVNEKAIIIVNKSIILVKKGKVKEAEKIIKPAIKYLLKMKCKKIILACTELPVAIFAFKSFKKVKSSKTFFDPNLILAKAAMKKYSLKSVK